MLLLRLRFPRWHFSQAVGVHGIFFIELIAAVCLSAFLIHMERNDATKRAEQARSARLEELHRIKAELMERRRRIREQIKNESRKRKRLHARAAQLTRAELLALAAHAQ